MASKNPLRETTAFKVGLKHFAASGLTTTLFKVRWFFYSCRGNPTFENP
jgi:hypothetical protein